MKLAILLLGIATTASAATLLTNGSISDINAKIAAATTGDRVLIPSGTYNNYGAGGAQIGLNKAVTLEGTGPATTIFNLASDAEYPFKVESGTGTVLKGFKVNQNSRSVLLINGAPNGWRITDIEIVDTASGSHPMQLTCSASYGVVDSSTFNMYGEQMFITGPTDSWTTADSFGTANAFYFENNTFNTVGDGYGYIDFNANARGVCRFNTITGQFKFDAHGIHSSTPRGSRHVEIYNNTWTNGGGNYAALEIRSGTGYFFKNTVPNSASPTTNPWFIRQEYYVAVDGQPASNYPFPDQVGVGQDPLAAASAPSYDWLNRRGASTKWYWEIYNVSMTGVINNDRDVFQETSGTFTGASGVGVGSRATMDGITPSLAKVGFWVEDEGSWDTTKSPNTSGRFYVWNGSAWVLKFTPYTYPHPLRTGGGGEVGQVETPNFSPVAGTYSSTQNVTITCATSGATIRYTIDGSTPTPTHGTIYSTPVAVASTTPLQAVAYNGVLSDSTVRSGTYTIASPGSGVVSGPATVTIQLVLPTP